MGKAHAHMLQHQSRTESAKNASDRHIFGFMRKRAVPTNEMAGIGASGVALAPGCTPINAHDRPAPLAAPSKLPCEYESVNVV